MSFNLTPPTSAQSAEATSPAGEVRKMSAEIISWCPYKKKNFALFDEEKLIVSYISLTYYKKYCKIRNCMMLVLKEFSNIQQVRPLIQGILGMRYRVL